MADPWVEEAKKMQGGGGLATTPPSSEENDWQIWSRTPPPIKGNPADFSLSNVVSEPIRKAVSSYLQTANPINVIKSQAKAQQDVYDPEGMKSENAPVIGDIKRFRADPASEIGSLLAYGSALPGPGSAEKAAAVREGMRTAKQTPVASSVSLPAAAGSLVGAGVSALAGKSPYFGIYPGAAAGRLVPKAGGFVRGATDYLRKPPLGPEGPPPSPPPPPPRTPGWSGIPDSPSLTQPPVEPIQPPPGYVRNAPSPQPPVGPPAPGPVRQAAAAARSAMPPSQSPTQVPVEPISPPVGYVRNAPPARPPAGPPAPGPLRQAAAQAREKLANLPPQAQNAPPVQPVPAALPSGRTVGPAPPQTAPGWTEPPNVPMVPKNPGDIPSHMRGPSQTPEYTYKELRGLQNDAFGIADDLGITKEQMRQQMGVKSMTDATPSQWAAWVQDHGGYEWTPEESQGVKILNDKQGANLTKRAGN